MAVGITAVGVVLASAVPAFANAANPLPDSKGTGTPLNATTQTNQDGSIKVLSGSVGVNVGGTWNWGEIGGSTAQKDCISRFGVGWAVDWFGVSSSPIAGTTGLPIKNTSLLFHVTTEMDGTYPFTGPCTIVDADGFPQGPWTASHTYNAGDTIPPKLCVNMYDLHGKPNQINNPDTELNPAKNGDNSIKTNAFNPANTTFGYCFTPIIRNASKIVTSATNATLGGSISDTATLSGTVSATGSITFKAYSNDACTAEVFSKTVAVNGNGSYPSGPFTPGAVGNYKWIASYTGDINNAPAAGACGDNGETSRVTANPDLGIKKTAPSSVLAGQNITFKITLTNTGTVSFPNATWSDNIPANTTFVSVGAPCLVNAAKTAVSCNVGTLAVGASFGPIDLVVKAPATTATVTNTAKVVPVTPTLGDDSSTTTTKVLVRDLGITKDGPAEVKLGDNITYAITIKNTGTASFPNATWSDAIPANTSFVSVGAPCIVNAAKTSISCNVGTLAVGASFGPISLVVKTLQVGTVTNTAKVVPVTPTPADDQDTVETKVTTSDLKILKTAPSSVLSGQNITFKITLTNTGTVPFPNATWSDNIPANTTFVSVGAPCTVNAAKTVVTCNVGTLAVGASFGPIDLVVKAPATTTTVTNTAKVVPITPTLGDDSSTTTTKVLVRDLGITKDGPAEVKVGDNITYAITIKNTGTASFPNATWSDAIPANTSFVSVGAPCIVNAAKTSISCNVGTLAVGASFGPINLVVKTLEVGTVTNTAKVVPVTPTPADDQDTVETKVEVAPVLDLGIKKTGPALVKLGNNITYGITITNTGNVPYDNATWTDAIPANTSFVSVGAPCLVSGDLKNVTCNVGTLAPGASSGPISLVVKTLAVGKVTNTAKVPGDDTPDDDSSTVETNVVKLDLGIKKTGPATVNLGDNITYGITITNTGVLPYPNATWTDNIPATTTYVSVGAPCTVNAAKTVVTCNVGTLQPGASVGPISLVVKTTKVTTVVNTAKVPTDDTPGDDSSTVRTTVNGPAYSVRVAYADNLHTVGGIFIPSFWQGSPGVTFVGCNAPVTGPCTNISPVNEEPCPTVAANSPAACYDSGAIRLENNTTIPIPLSTVQVTIGTCTWNPWIGEPQALMTIPANGALILAQTGGEGPNVACGLGPDPEEGFNFDTSDSTVPAQGCPPNGLIPRVDVSVSGGATTSFFDSGQVLNTGGVDPSCLVFNQNEGHDWTAPL